MTKRQIIQLIEHGLHGGNFNPDLKGKFHPNIIAFHIQATLDDIFIEIFKSNNVQKIAADLDLWSKTYKNVPILYDSDLDLFYSNMPAKIVQLPKQRAIRRISPMQSPGITFKPLSDNAKSVMSRLDVAKYDTDTWFSFDFDRIEFANVPVDMQTDGVVLIRMIPAFTELADTDTYSIPSGFNDFLIETIKSKLLGTPPEKQSDNNNSKRIWQGRQS
uniref:Uncharacterized protein n=1 Tax=viral metagenome TaxID=1070528 RepID=A0A6M3J2P7_9ZZZZ